MENLGNMQCKHFKNYYNKYNKAIIHLNNQKLSFCFTIFIKCLSKPTTFLKVLKSTGYMLPTAHKKYVDCYVQCI